MLSLQAHNNDTNLHLSGQIDTCDQEHRTPATATPTTTTSVVNDTSNRRGIQTLI